MQYTRAALEAALEEAGIRSSIPAWLLGRIDPDEWLRDREDTEITELELEGQRQQKQAAHSPVRRTDTLH